MSQARVSITPADAWSDQRLTPLQCRLLGLIGSYLGKDHTAWPSQSTLAADLGVSRKAVNEGIRALVNYGYIRAQERFRTDGGQTSSVYFVIMDPKDRGGILSDTPCNAEVTPPSPESDTPCNPIEVTPPVTLRGYTKDPIERPNEEAFRILGEIWEAWSSEGKKRSKAKGKIADQLKALSKASDLQAIKAAAIAFARETEGKFHPALDRWLAAGKWENWAAAEAPALQAMTEQDWQRAMRHWTDTGDWLASDICPAPDQPGCTAPAGLLVYAAKIVPDKANEILANAKRSAA